MRTFFALLLSFSLALSAAQAASHAAQCAGQSVVEAQACCHPQAPACDIPAFGAAYCCPGEAPAAPVPVSPAAPPAPVVLLELPAPTLHLGASFSMGPAILAFSPAHSGAPPPLLYQLHRSYRI